MQVAPTKMSVGQAEEEGAYERVLFQRDLDFLCQHETCFINNTCSFVPSLCGPTGHGDLPCPNSCETYKTLI